MNIKEIENEFKVSITVDENYNKETEWKYVAYSEEEDDLIVLSNTLEELVLELTEWRELDYDDDDDYISDSEWARSIDYGGYDTEDEFWEHIYKF